MTKEDSSGLKAQLDRALEYVTVLQKNAHLSERRIQVLEDEIDKYDDVHATIKEVEKENARLRTSLDEALKDNAILREICANHANSVLGDSLRISSSQVHHSHLHGCR
jgi:hypothetical protein